MTFLLFQLHDLIWHVCQSTNDVSVCCWHFSETEKTHSAFQTTYDYKVKNQKNFYKVCLYYWISILTNALQLWLNNNHFLRTARWNVHWILFQISDISIFCTTELLSWEKSDRYHNKVLYKLSFLLLFIYPCMSVSYPCEFIQSDVPISNTLLLLIPNEFGTLFKLGVQR